jgi:hypothetical protein
MLMLFNVFIYSYEHLKKRALRSLESLMLWADLEARFRF